MVRVIPKLQLSRWRARRWVAVALGIGFAGVPGPLQGQGARPIEFSESRGGSTNAPDPGASRSRLDSLESQISKSFDFLNADESLRGAQAPLPRVPARTPVPRQPRKKPGLFDDDQAWIQSDPLREPEPESDGEEWGSSRGKPRSEARPGLRENDWLAPSGDLGEEFWQLSANADAPRSSWLLPAKEDLVANVPRTEPLLERLFGVDSGARSSSVADFDRFDPLNRTLSPSARTGAEARQDQYRELLGMEGAANPPAFQPSDGQPSASGWNSLPSRPSTWAASPWSTPAATRSLSPVHMAQERPLLPLSPTAPQRPSVQSLYEWDPDAAAPAPSATPAASPFQTPIRRGFQ